MNFEALFIKISPRLKRIARRYSAYTYLIDEDDLYQEMCVHLWNRFKDGFPQDLTETYIVKGCEFHTLNYLRKHRDKVRIVSLEKKLTEEGNTLKDILPDAREPLDRTVDKRLVIAYIRNNGFTEREKEVFSLLLEGCTVREVGKSLAISHVMVVKLKNRLIEKCKKKLK